MLKRGGGEWGDGESSGKMGGNHCFYRKNISRFFSNMQDKRFFTPKNRTSSQTLINRAAALPPSAKRSDLKCQGLSTRIYTKGKDGAKYLSADSARSLPWSLLLPNSCLTAHCTLNSRPWHKRKKKRLPCAGTFFGRCWRMLEQVKFMLDYFGKKSIACKCYQSCHVFVFLVVANPMPFSNSLSPPRALAMDALLPEWKQAGEEEEEQI